ncbi:histidine triad hydrolase [Chloropicon primus]|uniref:Histidine triad hydrolase n=1 Tax=Chloropicon primus TaxID=1764295 RepID=A0A5B8MRM8_9CHLO|nr:histidine triad hydrolase [Chloropicon primus]UPR01521.1 histidine triad hydrolase [Chloropicon primus]|eukprot:QDZ22305.1 histidine triad hydrolase [Chloropicon primus]
MAPIETEEGFEVWPQLSDSKHVVCKWKLSTVYMMDDTNYPCWLVLVPRRKGAEEISDLSENDQQELMREMMKASNALKSLFNPAKMNIAAIGNMCRQLHIHVTARTTEDPSWPGPCYGLPMKKFDEAGLAKMLETLRAKFDE